MENVFYLPSTLFQKANRYIFQPAGFLALFAAQFMRDYFGGKIAATLISRLVPRNDNDKVSRANYLLPTIRY